MFRISQYLREITNPTPIRPYRGPKGPVVIWNLLFLSTNLKKLTTIVSGRSKPPHSQSRRRRPWTLQ